jgi:cytochrome P450
MSDSNDGRAIPNLDWRSKDYLRDPKGHLADLVRDLFDPFPARVLAPMLGLPPGDVPMVANWVSVSARWVNHLLPPSELLEVEAAFRDLENYLLDLLRARRTNLGGDLLSELIREMEGSDEMQVVGMAAELNRAGMDTTRRRLTNTMYALLQHPQEWARLTANPERRSSTSSCAKRCRTASTLASRPPRARSASARTRASARRSPGWR